MAGAIYRPTHNVLLAIEGISYHVRLCMLIEVRSMQAVQNEWCHFNYSNE